MKKVIDFIKGSVEEMTANVTWPSYSELQSSTVLVIVASLIFALLIGMVDLAFETAMGVIYQQ
jgi:preprotein translocase subunit SecE